MQIQTQTQISPAEIKAGRERLGKTQPQLAELVGVSPKTISNWETGASEPLNKMGRLLEVLNSQPEAPPRAGKPRSNEINARLAAIEARLHHIEQRMASNYEDIENLAARQDELSGLLAGIQAVANLVDPRDSNPPA